MAGLLNATKVFLSKELLRLLKNASYWNEEFNISEFMDISLMEQLPEYDECSNSNCMGFLKEIAIEYGRYYHVYVSIAICLFGIISNFINVIVLTKKELSSAPVNRILTAFGINEILIKIEYIPFAYYYYVELPEKMNFPYYGALYILFHMHFSQILSTFYICLSIMLPIWRYLAIRYPDRSHTICTNFRCNVGIYFCFGLSILLCIPIYLTFKIGTIIITEDKDYTLYVIKLSEIAKENEYLVLNFWLYAVIIKLLPCCLLSIISALLIRILYEAKKRNQMLKNNSFCMATNGMIRRKLQMERVTKRTTQILLAILLLFLMNELPQGIFGLIIGIKGKCVFLKCYQYFGAIMDCMALLNGSITLSLYCWMNSTFRTAFGRLFGGTMLTIWRPSAPRTINTTYV